MSQAAPQPDVSATAITPFWQRMPRLFLFPLQPAPLSRNVIATVGFCVVAWFTYPALTTAPLRAGLTMVLAWAAAAFFIAHYAFLVIERTAFGYLDSRSYPRNKGAVDWRRPAKMFVVMLLVPALIIIIGHLILPGFLVLLLLLAFALLLPASVMVMTMTDSFSDAVNPMRCLQTALHIGTPYLVLCLFLLMLLIGSQQTLHVLLPGPTSGAPHAAAAGAVTTEAPVTSSAMESTFSLGFAWLVVSFVGNYFLVLMCALIGYVMYQYSAVLGIAVVGPGDARVRGSMSAAAHARRVREAMIGKLVAAGDFREAIELLNEDLRERPNDLSLHVRLHTLLVHEGSTPRIQEHAERYLELLLAASNFKEALKFLEQTRERIPSFGPKDPGRLPQLAGAAIEAGKPALAAELIRGFDRKYPGHPKIPDVYVVAARVMLQADRASEAQGLLRHVTNTYRDSAAAAEAKRYLARFEPASGAAAGATATSAAAAATPAATPASTSATDAAPAPTATATAPPNAKPPAAGGS
ncbi:MAG TPA: hypothetical protein VEI29_05365 [Burkholderiaceae bacterium]|nr:hypothetical protein [Burkholderiaceae bacterium]